MSVTTSADSALDQAKDSVRDAIRELSKILIDQCWGHDEYTSAYKQGLHEVLISLTEQNMKLNPHG